MKTAYSYIRFSSKAQQDGDSIRRQLDASEHYCAKHSMTLSPKNYADLGISGFQEKTRASLDDMLAAISNGSIKHRDAIILENMDRLSRRGIDHTQEVLKSILRHGVEVHDLHNNLILTRDSLNDLTAVIRVALAADLAHRESLNKSIRVKAAKAAQREAAKQGQVINKRLPLWLRRHFDTYQFNERVDDVRLMIQLRQQGMGFKSIARELNIKGIPTRYQKKNGWSDTTIREFITSPALYGAYLTGTATGNGKWAADSDGLILDYYPALISFHDWQLIQPRLISRTGGNSKKNPVSGVARCGMCGSVFIRKHGIRKGREYTYFLCRQAQVAGGCSQKRGVRDLDLLIISQCHRLLIAMPKNDNKKRDIAEQELNKLQSRKLELEGLLVDSGSALSSILKAITDINEKISHAQSELNQMVSVDDSAITSLIDHKDDPIQFNLNLKKVVQKIEVSPSGKGWLVKMFRRDGHSIMFDSHGIFQPSDTEKFKNELMELVADTQFHDFDD